MNEERKNFESSKPNYSVIGKTDWQGTYGGQEETDEKGRVGTYFARDLANLSPGFHSEDFLGLPGSTCALARGRHLSSGRREDFWILDRSLDLCGMTHDVVPSSTTNQHLSLMWRVICLLLLCIKIVCHRTLVPKNSLKVKPIHFTH